MGVERIVPGDVASLAQGGHTIPNVSSIADRIRLLRQALGISQDELGPRCVVNGKPLDRAVISHLETGHNQASTARIREALATGFGVPESALKEYLFGDLPLADIMKAVKLPPLVKQVGAPLHKTLRDWEPNVGPALDEARANGEQLDWAIMGAGECPILTVPRYGVSPAWILRLARIVLEGDWDRATVARWEEQARALRKSRDQTLKVKPDPRPSERIRR